MRAIVSCLLLLSVPAFADDKCPAKPDDPCFREQRDVCNVDVNPPPWSTPESQEKKREHANKQLAACRKLPPPPAKKPHGNLPPWRQP